MSKIEQLIEQYCPDGVEYKKLKEVAIVSRGKRVTRKDLSDNDGYPVYQNSLKPLGFYSKTNYPRGTTFVICAGAAGEIGYSESDYWGADDCFSIICTDVIENRFVYHYLLNVQPFIKSNVRKSSIPRLSHEVIDCLSIPVPPLEVQREIVRVLDHFTLLSAELSAELKARKQQYEYYRDSLLSFKEIGGATRKIKLGDIGKISMCKRVLKSETSDKGDVPFFKIGTFGGQPNAFISRKIFEKYKSLYSYPKNGDVLISAAGTIGRAVIYNGEDAYYQDSNIVWIDNNEELVINKYLYYIYQLKPWRASTGGTIARLYNDNIARTEIMIPSLRKQHEIVLILDRFDALCNDISEGLPAEIEARQKQYEYYRDKLLSFKEKDTDA